MPKSIGCDFDFVFVGRYCIVTLLRLSPFEWDVALSRNKRMLFFLASHVFTNQVYPIFECCFCHPSLLFHLQMTRNLPKQWGFLAFPITKGFRFPQALLQQTFPRNLPPPPPPYTLFLLRQEWYQEEPGKTKQSRQLKIIFFTGSINNCGEKWLYIIINGSMSIHPDSTRTKLSGVFANFPAARLIL